MTDLYHPPDVAEAHEVWGATCGPCSLAAALRRPVASVFEAVSDPPTGLPGIDAATFRGWMTIGHMKTAVVRAGAHLDREWSPATPRALEDLLSTPAFAGTRMLACLQWGGPWPPRAAARFRHWVALCLAQADGEQGLAAYDWNAGHRVTTRTVAPGQTTDVEEVLAGGWLFWSTWERLLLPNLLPERGDGTFKVQWAGVVRA